MRIGLLTTLQHNIGDDLIRIGLQAVLEEVLDGRDPRWVAVNKHLPMTVYPPWHPVSWTRHLPRGRNRAAALLGGLLHSFGGSVFDACDALVQCGAPVYWPGCHRAEWAETVWHQVLGRLAGDRPVLNLAAGSCYPWERQPERFESAEDADYVRRITAYCRATSVRDPLARRLVASVGPEPALIPCSAFLATRDESLRPGEGLVVVNYMAQGGHFEWGQHIDASVWEGKVRGLLARLGRRHRLAFLCHDDREERLARRLDPALPRIFPRDGRSYGEALGGVEAALCNRMHASVALAGMGIPSVAVGTDTRLRMVEMLGLPIRFAKDADEAELEAELEALVARRGEERERLRALQDDTWRRYARLMREALP